MGGRLASTAQAHAPELSGATDQAPYVRELCREIRNSQPAAVTDRGCKRELSTRDVTERRRQGCSADDNNNNELCDDEYGSLADVASSPI